MQALAFCLKKADKSEKLETFPNNFKQFSFTIEVNKHYACGYSIFTIFAHDAVQDRLDIYRGLFVWKRFAKPRRIMHQKQLIAKRKKILLEKIFEAIKKYPEV